MDEKLEAFLAGKSGQGIETAQPVVAEVVTVEPVVVETTAPEVDPAAAAPEPVASTTAPAPDDEDDDPPPAASAGHVPVSVLQAEREKRKDWKAQAIRNAAEKAAADGQIKAAEERFKALQAQLDELKKVPATPAPPPAATQATPAVPPPAPEPMPNPAEDPEGYARWYGNQQARRDEQQAMVAFNLRLETTEDLLREKEGDEAVDKAIAAFKAMVATEEQTFGARQSPLAKALTVQRNPYRWMYNQVRKAEADKEIGGDLAGFKAKTETEIRSRVEAEIRAKIEAEMAEKAAAAAAAAPPIQIAAVPMRAAPNVVLPKSLANAPSAAPRSAPAWTGPTPLADITARR